MIWTDPFMEGGLDLFRAGETRERQIQPDTKNKKWSRSVLESYLEHWLLSWDPGPAAVFLGDLAAQPL